MNASLPIVRINPQNPNHHLYRNNGRTWWLHYTLHCADYTAQRVRASLGTKTLKIARARRDAVLTHLKLQARLGLPLNPPSFLTEGRAA
jgi:hypothetical protein